MAAPSAAIETAGFFPNRHSGLALIAVFDGDAFKAFNYPQLLKKAESILMSPEQLVYMANQIATSYQSQPYKAALDGFAEHINEFWEPAMRERLLELIAADNRKLKPLVVDAGGKIRPPKAQQRAAV